MPGSHHGERTSDLFGTSSPPQSRRKSIWMSEPRVLKLKTKKAPLSQHQHPPLAAGNGHFHLHHRSNSPVREKKKKKESFLDALFPKRKGSSAAALQNSNAAGASPATVPKRKATPTPEAIARGVEILKSIFPKWDTEPLQALLEFNDYIMEEAISAILKMEAADESANEAKADDEAANGALNFPIKNPLADDFLRVSMMIVMFMCSYSRSLMRLIVLMDSRIGLTYNSYRRTWTSAWALTKRTTTKTSPS